MSAVIHQGDWLEVLRTLPDCSVHCVVTSPPYWGLRDYGTATWEGGDAECDHRMAGERRQLPHGDGRANDCYADARVLIPGVGAMYKSTCGKCGATRVDRQLGLERTPEEYVAKMVEGFREVRRVLRDDATCWVNLGDSYSGSWARSSNPGGTGESSRMQVSNRGSYTAGESECAARVCPPGLKPKDLCGIPWMVAFALRADGWYLRQDIVWSKPNPMPESVTDRCTKSHEYIFLLTKSARYWYDATAIKEPCLDPADDLRRISQATLDGKSTPTSDRNGIRRTIKRPDGWAKGSDHTAIGWATPERQGQEQPEYLEYESDGKRNKRSVWNVATSPFPEAHFATFPPEIPEICIKAGCPEGGTVLDPFCGAGTTGVVAKRLMRSFVGIELNPQYVEMARRRIVDDAPLFNEVSTFAQESHAEID